jgi:hypothetical protein
VAVLGRAVRWLRRHGAIAGRGVRK